MMSPVIFNMFVIPCAVWELGFPFRNPAMEASCWLRLAPEYLTLLKLMLMDPLSALMMSALLRDLTGPEARRFKFIVPAPLTLSSAVTPYALASDRIAGLS